jgi:response regulator RpfG family c-di-GMP phosphodiesterase
MIASCVNDMIKGLKQRTDELQTTQDVTILSLASLAETRDNETGNHIFRTQQYVRLLAEQLMSSPSYGNSLDEDMVALLYKSSPLHDIGKVGIPDAILLKPGPLTNDEWMIMKRHTLLGRDALRIAEERLGSSSFLGVAQELIYSHHEKWDGSGYPEGLSGSAIPLSGRLMALADVYDALRTDRPYKRAFPHDTTRTIIIEGKGTHFDPDVVEAFLIRESDFIRISTEYQD